MKLLQGKKVLITREQKQALVFAEEVERLGASAFIADVTRITCTGAEIAELPLVDFQWIFFTSANGVDCFFRGLDDLEQLRHVKIAVVGSKTNEALKRYGFRATFIPSKYNAATMAKEFLDTYKHIGKVLFVRGSKARPELVDAFLAHGKDFEVVEVYKTEVHLEKKNKLTHILQHEFPDYITFTSPFAVEAFHQLYPNPSMDQSIIVCIGTTTEAAAKKQGWKNILVPEKFTIEGMIDVMVAYHQQERQEFE